MGIAMITAAQSQSSHSWCYMYMYVVLRAVDRSEEGATTRRQSSVGETWSYNYAKLYGYNYCCVVYIFGFVCQTITFESLDIGSSYLQPENTDRVRI